MNRKYLRFFFNSNNGGQFGATTNQQIDPNQNQGQGQTQQNQQQQQQQPVYKDPFEGMDLETFDDVTRNAITASRAETQRLANEAATARSHQSRADKAAADLQRLQTEIQQKAQQKQATTEQLTPEQEIAEEYVKEGVPRAEAERLAGLQSRVFNKVLARNNAHLSKALQPTLASVAHQQTQSSFAQAQNSLQLLQDPALAQSVWEAIEAQVQQTGEAVSPGVIQQMAKILYVDMGLGQQTQQQQQQVQQQTPPFNPQWQPQFQQQQAPIQQQQQSRFTFPGAGAFNNRPVGQVAGNGSHPAMNSDTLRASEIVNALMTKHSFTGAPVQPKITRGN